MAFKDNLAYFKPLRWGEKLFLIFNFLALIAVVVFLVGPSGSFSLLSLLFFLAIVYSTSALQRRGFLRIPEPQRSEVVRKRLAMMEKNAWLFRVSLKVPLILWAVALGWLVVGTLLLVGLVVSQS